MDVTGSGSFLITGVIRARLGVSNSSRSTSTCDRLCDLVVRVTAYRSRGPGSIPGSTRFSEK
jgi:hypothetical protein